MKSIMEDINAAFNVISSIPVQGDAIDAMAIARSKLRNAYAKLRDMEMEKSDDSCEKNEGD